MWISYQLYDAVLQNYFPFPLQPVELREKRELFHEGLLLLFAVALVNLRLNAALPSVQSLSEIALSRSVGPVALLAGGGFRHKTGWTTPLSGNLLRCDGDCKGRSSCFIGQPRVDFRAPFHR